MYKTFTKLAAAGVMITALLAVVMITQGCDNTAKAPTQNTNPSYTLIVDPTGGHCDETTGDTASGVTQPSITVDETGIHIDLGLDETEAPTPTEPAPTEKPTLGEVIKDFFENLFGGDKDKPTEPETTTQPDGAMTYQDYLDMNDDQRAEFMLSFAQSRDESLDLFAEWLRVATAEHKDENVIGTIGPDGNINLEDYLKP